MIILCSLCVAVSVFGSQYSVVLERFPNEQLAEERLGSLGSDGFAPIFTESKGEEYCVMFGRFSTAAEAHWYAKELKLRGYFTDVVEPATEGEECSTPGYPYEKIAGVDTIANAPEVNFDRNTDGRVAAFWTVMDTADIAGARQKALEILNSAAKDDPIAGWCILKLAYLDCKEGKKEEAIPRFKMVADGKIACSRSHRIEGLYRYAYLLGRNKQRIDAGQAFREVARFANDPDIKTDSLVQLAGKELELARSGTVSYDEARDACNKVLQVATPEQLQAKATAELMYAETYAYHGCNPGQDLDMATELFKEVVSKYPNQRRECGMASYWISFCYRCKNDIAQAKSWAIKVVDMNLEQSELFRNQNLAAKAMFDLAIMEHHQSNDEESMKWAERLKATYPESKQAKEIDTALLGAGLSMTVFSP
jgi:tetratricopeptide (TPR) repeat protein